MTQLALVPRSTDTMTPPLSPPLANITPARPWHTAQPLPYLKAWRQRVGWTRLDLAVRSGVSMNTVQRLECGGVARPHTRHRLAAAFGIDTQTLLHRPPATDEAVTPAATIRASESGDGRLLFYIASTVRWRVPLFGDSIPALATLARRTGIAAATLHALLRQEQPATLVQATAIAQALDMRVLAVLAYH